MNLSSSERPSLSSELTGSEFLRWYWLKDELVDFARHLGIRASGGKELLAQRIAAHLDGTAFSEPRTPKRTAAPQLCGPLSPETVIPVGQRCSQVLRAWFTEQVGASFHFDGEMRAFFANSDGTATLAQALDHWYGTRDQGQKTIDAQFEYNRFTRDWHTRNPDGSKAELLEAWRQYRDQPIDARGRA